MVEIQFVDGTTENIEAVEDTYVYDKKSESFMVAENEGRNWASFPREFVKSIRVIEV